MGSQSNAKTIFLLVSMVGWLLAGAALMYLFPAIAHLVVHSDRTALWLDNLSRGGYHPMLGTVACVGLVVAEALGNWIWYSRYDGKI